MYNNKTVMIINDIISPIAQEMGLYIWDINFEKEGPNWYLRIFIDKDDGISILDCENFSRKIDKLIDDADPIDRSYFLEVSSPGICRKLVHDWHINKYINHIVDIRFIRPINDLKEVQAKLLALDGEKITVLLNNNEKLTFLKKQAAFIKLAYDILEKVEFEKDE